MEPQSSNKNMGLGIGLAVVVIAVIVIFFATKKPVSENLPVSVADTTSQIPTETPVATTTNSNATTSSNQYKDGTYTAVGSYMSPGGPDKLSVTVTVTDDVITDVSLIKMAGDPRSAQIQTMFEGAYKPFVVGKKLSELSLGKVSGSSLTPKGFNDALAQIRLQAKA